MFNGLKTSIRDMLPIGWQVPAKYWFGRLSGSLEPEMGLLGALVVERGRVVDVGGNRGIYAYQLWRLGTKVEIFEPNPTCCSVLHAWGARKLTVNVHSVALSSGAGTANLHIPIDGAGIEHDASASIENTGFNLARDELVQLQTLDSYGFEGVSLIKVDVEGHEYSVIEGAAATIASSRPALLIEIEQRHTDRPISAVFDKILAFGYQGYFLAAGRLQALTTFDVTRHQSMTQFGKEGGEYINNFLFLHSARLLAGEYRELVDARSLK